MHATQGARQRARSTRMRYVFSGVTTRNCRELPLLFVFETAIDAPLPPPLIESALSATSTAALVRSTLTDGPIFDARRCMVSTPGVVAASHRFCHRRKLPCHTLT